MDRNIMAVVHLNTSRIALQNHCNNIKYKHFSYFFIKNKLLCRYIMSNLRTVAHIGYSRTCVTWEMFKNTHTILIYYLNVIVPSHLT